MLSYSLRNYICTFMPTFKQDFDLIFLILLENFQMYLVFPKSVLDPQYFFKQKKSVQLFDDLASEI